MTEPSRGDAPISAPIHRAPPPRQRPLWRTLIWIVGVVLVALLVAFLLTPHGGSGAGGGQAGGGRGGHSGGRGGGAGAGGGGGRRPPTVVGVATAKLGDIPIEITALGSVTPQANVTVQSRIAGTLMAVYFQEGQMVRKGQLLALVDPRPYQVALEQAQGQLMRDEAALDQARLDLARYRTLAAQDSIARQQVDQQSATVKQDEGVVKSDRASVDSAKLNIAYCHIAAPVAGRVGLRQVDAGNYVTTSETNGLVVIAEVDPITVIFTVPEDDIPQINQRMAATGKLPVTAYDRTGANQLAQGQLLTLDNQIDPTTGTVKARAQFSNPNGVLFPQQFVNVTVLSDTLKDVVTIPAVAVRHGPQGDFVYVVQLDSTVKMTPVKVGPAQGETASISTGVSVGDQVVTDGGDRLSDGATVVLPQDAAAMAQRMNRKPKPTGIMGWIQGLFGGGKKAHQGSGEEAASSGGGGGGYGGGAGGSGNHRGGGRMMALIGQLDLTPDQKTKAQTIFATARQQAMSSDDPDARRKAMQAAQVQLEAILTPEQKAKLAQLRAQQGGEGGGGHWGSGGGGSQPPAASAPTAAPSSAPHPRGAQPAISSAPAAANAGGGGSGGGGGHGGQGGGGGRLAMVTDQLGLDAGQQAKAQAIFAAARAKAEGSNDPDARRTAMHEAMSQLATILRPDQQAKLQALRAQREAGGGGGPGGGR